MKPKTLLVLLLLVLGLGSFIWFYERKLPGSEEQAANAKKLVALKTEDVTGVEIERDGQKIRLERAAPAKPSADAVEDKTWKLVSPIAARADRWAVERLIDTLTNLDKQRELDAADRAELGLDKPRAKVTLTTAQGARTISIGAAVPAGSALAAEVEGGKPAIVSDALWTDLAKPPGDWRSKDVFGGPRDAIERLTLTAGAQRVLLGKRGDAFWEESPVVDRADRDAVNKLLGDLAGLQVVKFLDPADQAAAGLGLDPPTAALEAVLKGQERPFKLELGGPDPKDGGKVFARVDGTLITLDGKIAESIKRSPVEWRSPVLSSLEVYRVDGAELTDPQGVLKLARAGSDWKRNDAKVSFTPVSDLLYALTGARADKLLSRAEAEQAGAQLAKPWLSAKLAAADKSEETLVLYPPLPDGAAVATASGRDGIYLLLPKATITDVSTKLDTLRKAEPLKERPEDQAKPKS